MAKYRHNLKVKPFILGDKDHDEVVFNVLGTASSVLEENENQNYQKSVVKMKKIDTYYIENNVIPDFIKLDTQGYEYQILEGAKNILPHVKYVLAELNFLDIHLAHEVVHLLSKFDFVPYDVTEFHRRPSDSALWQIDVPFCKSGSDLRKSKKW